MSYLKDIKLYDVIILFKSLFNLGCMYAKTRCNLSFGD